MYVHLCTWISDFRETPLFSSFQSSPMPMIQQLTLLIIATVSLILAATALSSSSSSALAAFQTRPSATLINHQQHRLHLHATSSTTTQGNDSEEECIGFLNANKNPLLKQHSRRNVLLSGLTSNLVILSFRTSNDNAANAEVIRSGGCVYGEGDACDALAEGNEFIQRLQKKSSENKEANKRVREREKF